ncbi:unnamed protein product [Calicophoron daubneyi]|uniref:Uncharacterized protein n=1 Tax=Calicophoron daubneyi TaxID=300641 RepID=A0AAV2TAI0_CALDB
MGCLVSPTQVTPCFSVLQGIFSFIATGLVAGIALLLNNHLNVKNLNGLNRLPSKTKTVFTSLFEGLANNSLEQDETCCDSDVEIFGHTALPICMKNPLRQDQLKMNVHLSILGHVFDVSGRFGSCSELTGFLPGTYLDPMGYATDYMKSVMKNWRTLLDDTMKTRSLFSRSTGKKTPCFPRRLIESVHPDPLCVCAPSDLLTHSALIEFPDCDRGSSICELSPTVRLRK